MILILFVLVDYGDTGSTPKDQNEIEVVKVVMNDLDILCVGYGDTVSTSKDRSEVGVYKLSKTIPATTMKEDDVPFVLFSETDVIVDDYFSPMYNGFKGVLKIGEDATIERIHYMPKHEYEFKAKVWNNYIPILVYLDETVYFY